MIIENEEDLNKIKSNNLPFCIRCNELITSKNDSGWEEFLEDGITTQPICKKCEDKESKESAEKESE